VKTNWIAVLADKTKILYLLTCLQNDYFRTPKAKKKTFLAINGAHKLW
jgi:hypothetical protein